MAKQPSEVERPSEGSWWSLQAEQVAPEGTGRVIWKWATLPSSLHVLLTVPEHWIWLQQV